MFRLDSFYVGCAKVNDTETGVTLRYAHIFQYTQGHTHIKYLYVYAPGLCSTLFRMYCAT